MKVTKQKELACGDLEVTVRISPDETLMAVRDGGYYKLGYPYEDIVRADQILEAKEVSWCVVGQKWSV